MSSLSNDMSEVMLLAGLKTVSELSRRLFEFQEGDISAYSSPTAIAVAFARAKKNNEDVPVRLKILIRDFRKALEDKSNAAEAPHLALFTNDLTQWFACATDIHICVTSDSDVILEYVLEALTNAYDEGTLKLQRCSFEMPSMTQALDFIDLVKSVDKPENLSEQVLSPLAEQILSNAMAKRYGGLEALQYIAFLGNAPELPLIVSVYMKHGRWEFSPWPTEIASRWARKDFPRLRKQSLPIVDFASQSSHEAAS